MRKVGDAARVHEKASRRAEVQRLLTSCCCRVKDPRLTGARISEGRGHVDLSSHGLLQHAALDDDPDPIKEVEQARGFFRSRVANSLHLRRDPELRFGTIRPLGAPPSSASSSMTLEERAAVPTEPRRT